MQKKEMVAMLLAGGQGSRLGILTKKTAKPSVTFGGKYRIIDFTLSNCINSDVDTIGVLTQYRPLQLNQHIGIGIPWDLDKRSGGVTILAPQVKSAEETGGWFMGTANAVYLNIEFIEKNNPEYLLILSGDHIYKMDYSKMLDFHKKKGGVATIAVFEVPLSEACRFGIMNTNEDGRIIEFEEKPKAPKNNLASMGIYIFTWDKIKDVLIEDNKEHNDSDFGKHIIPRLLLAGEDIYAYKFKGYWKDVGTIDSYWEANMEFTKTVPQFNLYEDFWKIYTNSDHQPPQYTGPSAKIKSSVVSEGSEVYGEVYNSVLGIEVTIAKGAIIRDSIIMSNTTIGEGCLIEKCIIDEGSVISRGVKVGIGENIPNEEMPNVYDTGITVFGENTYVPPNVKIGKNCAIFGVTETSDYPGGEISSGKTIIKEEGAK